MLAIKGASSAIAKELIVMLPRHIAVAEISRSGSMPLACERYLFCNGLLRAKRADDQTQEERAEGFTVNCQDIVYECDRIIRHNDFARICVIGSESAYSGSFDDTYAAAKAQLHKYVEHKRLRTPHQQLVCVSPSIIEDAGMTIRRADRELLAKRREKHPKGRFLLAREVAAVVHYALYVDQGYLTGVVVRLNGGVNTWLA